MSSEHCLTGFLSARAGDMNGVVPLGPIPQMQSAQVASATGGSLGAWCMAHGPYHISQSGASQELFNNTGGRGIYGGSFIDVLKNIWRFAAPHVRPFLKRGFDHVEQKAGEHWRNMRQHIGAGIVS